MERQNKNTLLFRLVICNKRSLKEDNNCDIRISGVSTDIVVLNTEIKGRHGNQHKTLCARKVHLRLLQDHVKTSISSEVLM